MSSYGAVLDLRDDTPVEHSRGRTKAILAAAALVATAGAVAFLSGASPYRPASVEDPAYNALHAAPVQCSPVDGDVRTFNKNLPMWDPRYSNGDQYQAAFYNACYYSFRCCTTTSNRNGCYVSHNFGAACKGCLAANAPRMVRGRCVDYLNDPYVKEHKEAVTTADQPSGWGLNELYADNGVPDINTAYAPLDDPNTPYDESKKQGEWANQFGEIKREDAEGGKEASCWAQYDQASKQAKEYAGKCFEVLSWCNLLCPRDTPQTADHVMCKHCVLFGFEEGDWRGDVFTNQLNGDSVSNSLCGFFPDRCDCRYQPGTMVEDPSSGFSGYPIGWEFCPKVHMATKYNVGTLLDVEKNIEVKINRLFPGSAGPEDYFASTPQQLADMGLAGVSGSEELQNCQDAAEAFVVAQGGCSNEEFARQEADELGDIEGTRSDGENPFLGGQAPDRQYTMTEASAQR